MGKKGKEAKRREKKQRTGRKHSTVKTHEYYQVSGDGVARQRKSCPRCGPGTWLGKHKNREYCGKCGYAETDKKPEQSQPQNQENPAKQEENKPQSPPENK